MNLIDTQLNTLFLALQTNGSFNPIVLSMLTDLFGVLLETSTVDLQNNKERMKMIIAIIDSFKHVQTTYAKEAYFSIVKSVFTFAHYLDSYTQITFPFYRGASKRPQLSACSAFNICSKFNQININVNDHFVDILLLLQVVPDERVSSFVCSLARNSDDMKFWILNLKRVIINDSLIDTQAHTIELSPFVKKCCLEVAQILLIKLGQSETLNTEFLDDIISSASKSASSDSLQLQVAAKKCFMRLFGSKNLTMKSSLLTCF